MTWAPNDLVSDVDLQAYESGILKDFGVSDWEEKRRKALEDWLAPILLTQGFDIGRLVTRYEADAVYGYTGATYTDKTSAATSGATDDLDLAGIFATAGSDALYIGSTTAFRGLSVRMLDSLSAVAATLTVAYWADGWVTLAIADRTQKTTGKTFSGGGAITWRVPADWVRRAVNNSDALYWVKVTISATPTSAKASQIGVIRRSGLCAPVTFRTLTLIMREAPTTKQAGPWRDKAEWYEEEADAALQRALQTIGGEFETDEPATDLISPTEAAQTVAQVSGGWKLSRA